LLCLTNLAAITFAVKEAKRADNNIKVAWVKLQPNGAWDVEFYDKDRGPDFFQTTIDYILRQWVERRFSSLSRSIDSDYGYAYTFMSPKLQVAFLDKSGFDAVGKATKVIDCIDCEELKVKVRNIDHYDSEATKFGNLEGTLYRTNVFATKVKIIKDGREGASQKVIIPVQWRIKSVDEIQADKSILKDNPIGLEIVSYDILKDVS
jgi:hypothetical protein